MSNSNFINLNDTNLSFPGLSPLQSYLLHKLNLNPNLQESFLDAEIFNIPSPFFLPNMSKAVLRLREAIDNKQSIYLFGDNDVDGLASIAILTSFLREQIPAENLILDHTKKEDTYGLSGQVVERILARKPNLLIALDCGTSNEKEIKLLENAGIEVLILDHHTIPTGDGAGILINPRLPFSEYPQDEIATVGLVSLFVLAYYLSYSSFFTTPYFFITNTGNSPEGALYFRGRKIYSGNIHDIPKSETYSKANLEEMYFVFFSSNNPAELEKNIQASYNKAYKMQALQTLLFNTKNELKLEYDALHNILIKKKYSDYDLYRIFVEVYFYYRPKIAEGFRSCLDLCAIGTITDMVPLLGVNRIFVRKGVKVLAYSTRAGLDALRNLLQIESKDLTSFHLGWEFGPSLNAPGRMQKAEDSLELMLCQDKTKSMQLALNVANVNKERKEITKSNLELMVFRIKNEKLNNEESIILYDENFKPGVTGLVASRVSEKFLKPVVLIGPVNDILKGSVRSITKHNLVEMLAPFKNELLEYGGHPGAAGFTLRQENLEAFMSQWKQSYKSLPAITSVEELAILIELNDITKEFMNELLFFEPFGPGNIEPIFLIKNILPQSFRFMGKDNLHGKFQANGKKGLPVDFVLWQKAKEFISFLNGHDRINVTGKLSYNIYKGRRTIQFVISDYES